MYMYILNIKDFITPLKLYTNRDGHSLKLESMATRTKSDLHCTCTYTNNIDFYCHFRCLVDTLPRYHRFKTFILCFQHFSEGIHIFNVQVHCTFITNEY